MKNIILILLFLQIPFLYAQNKVVMLNSFDVVNTSAKNTAEVNAAYQIIANSPISLKTKKEKLNNCENRAEFTYDVLQKMGFKPINFWVFKEGLADPAYTTTSAVNKSKGLCYTPVGSSKVLGCWGYHVATGIQIDKDGTSEIIIFDPWTQAGPVLLDKWALSFFTETSGRIAYVLPIDGKYKFYGTTAIGQVSLNKQDWLKNADTDSNQMYCGLCGITPNNKCDKKRFQAEITVKRTEINEYLKKNGISLD